MAIVHIEHDVSDFDAWKAMFDADPLDRQGSGVRRYQVQRGTTAPNHVVIDLELDDADQAGQMLERLRALWAGPAAAVMQNPSGMVLETVEKVDL